MTDGTADVGVSGVVGAGVTGAGADGSIGLVVLGFGLTGVDSPGDALQAIISDSAPKQPALVSASVPPNPAVAAIAADCVADLRMSMRSYAPRAVIDRRVVLLAKPTNCERSR